MINNLENDHLKQHLTNGRIDLKPKNYELYSQIAIQISETLSQLRHPKRLRLHESLEEKYKRMETGVEYDQYAEEFASKYWLRNYWKAVYACENLLNLEKTSSICTLGSGSGSDAVAVVTASNLHGTPSSLSLTLVDKSSRQLKLANHIISSIKHDLIGNNLEIESIQKEIQSFHSVQKFDLIMISHVLTENPDSLTTILSHAAELLNKSGTICIIEREETQFG